MTCRRAVVFVAACAVAHVALERITEYLLGRELYAGELERIRRQHG